VNRSNYRTRQASGVPGWGPAPGWGQPLSGWSPLVDHGPLPLRVAGSVARWWWPTLSLAGFGAVLGFVLGHDRPGPGLSTSGLLTIVLAALVVVLLSLHRSAGPGALARAAAEYAVFALLAVLLVLAGSGDHQPTDPTGSSAKTQVKQAGTAKPKAEATQDRPRALRVATSVARAVTKAIRAVTGAARWVVELWRQADQQANHGSRAPWTTTPEGEAMLDSPAVPASIWRLL
jgi:hypothetical protein